MTADPFPVDAHPDPTSSTAAIPAVTDAMMDHAAHHAAELVDGVAHGTIAHDAPPPVPAGAGGPGAEPERDTPGEDVAALASDAVGQPLVAVAEAAVDTVEASLEGAAEALSPGEPVSAPEAGRSDPADAFSRYTATVFGMMRTNMAATSAHVSALMQAKSVPEAVALNADHLRRQLDAMTAQARELTTLAQALTFDALQPLKGVIAPDR